MAKTSADLYAIKKCVNGTLTEIGGKAKAIKVDFCNTFDMETSSDKITPSTGTRSTPPAR